MNNEARTSTGAINRIYVDRRAREAGYLMSHHHCHPYFELSYIEHGSCRFFVEDNIYDLHDGDFLLIPPQLFHYTRYLVGSCLRCGVYFRASDLSPELLGTIPDHTAFFSELRIFQVPPAWRRQIGTLLDRMVAEEKAFDALSPVMLHFQLQELLLLCSRVCSLLSDNIADIHTTDRQVSASRSAPRTSPPPPASAPITSAANSARLPASACTTTWSLSASETPPLSSSPPTTA